MPSVLLVDDNVQLLRMYKTFLEQAGHDVRIAENRIHAVELLVESEPDVVITDLRVPELQDGLSLIRSVKNHMPTGGKVRAKLIVISGWTQDLLDTSEEQHVDRVLAKPLRLELLLRSIAELLLVLLLYLGLAPPVLAETFHFMVNRRAEVVADVQMSSPGSSWAAAGREAALAALTVDRGKPQHIMLYAGGDLYTYSVFLGALDAGDHELRIERHARYSAPPSRLEVAGAHFREFTPDDSYWAALANAPILYARANTIGRFTDIPLLAYCERIRDGGRPVLQYTMIFSNEDGGTSTRALMARWGRTTDIEYVYRASLDSRGAVEHATIQARDHQEIEFHGRREIGHPVLIPSTDNNMVSDQGTSPIRYQIPPIVMDLNAHSREEIMDEHPITYRVMAQELIRENKVRPFGLVDGEKAGDPRTYLYVEAKVSNQHSAMATLVRLRGEGRWLSSHLGRGDYAISRDGWIRTTVELPPRVTAAAIEEIGFECLVDGEENPEILAGTCRLEAVAKMFLLDAAYKPQPSLWSTSAPVEIPSGQFLTFALH